MPRSELTNVLRRARELHDYVQALTDDERNYLLDLLAPEPEAKPAKKKASKKAGKSRRAASLAGAIASAGRPHLGEGPVCTICSHTEDYEDHQQSSPHYHPFAPPASTAARQSSRNAAAATVESEIDARVEAGRT